MSSNFWTSSHSRYHLHPRSSLLASRSLDLQYCTPRQHYCLQIYFAGLLQKLGKRLMLRQLPIATAIVFFKRFYLKPGNAICETNPYLVLAACAYVAAKVEETPVHIKSVVAEAKAVFAGELGHLLLNLVFHMMGRCDPLDMRPRIEESAAALASREPIAGQDRLGFVTTLLFHTRYPPALSLHRFR